MQLHHTIPFLQLTIGELIFYAQCDEKFPQCTQCVLRDQICPGPVVGTIFVDMRPQSRTHAGNIENLSSTSQNSIITGIPNDNTAYQSSSSSGIASRDCRDDDVENQRYTNQLPLAMRPQIPPSHISVDRYGYNDGKESPGM
jgi:hypothetical protein